MDSKDCIYLILIAFVSIGFFLNGFYFAQVQMRRRRRLDVPFNDSGVLTELTIENSGQDAVAQNGRTNSFPPLTPSQIRDFFGNN